MATRKGIRAWVIRWDWCGAHAAIDQPVAAVLRPQTSPQQVKRIVELLYAAREYEPGEMLHAIRRNGHNPYPAQFDPEGDGRTHRVQWSGEISCGHNPFLVARLATAWWADDGSGRIEWEDDPKPS
jgi:hypothetical protein